MRIAILAAYDPSPDQPSVAGVALSVVSPNALPPGTVLLEHGGTMLKTLEAATGFDGLILIDGASMGMPSGGVGVFSLNELILQDAPFRVEFDNIDVEGDILYASKFLSLPPVRIVGIESCEGKSGAGEAWAGTREGLAGSLLDAVRQAIRELTPP